MASEFERLSEELRPIVGKYRKVFNPPRARDGGRRSPNR